MDGMGYIFLLNSGNFDVFLGEASEIQVLSFCSFGGPWGYVKALVHSG